MGFLTHSDNSDSPVRKKELFNDLFCLNRCSDLPACSVPSPFVTAPVVTVDRLALDRLFLHLLRIRNFSNRKKCYDNGYPCDIHFSHSY